jgi:hypothetical protein
LDVELVVVGVKECLIIDALLYATAYRAELGSGPLGPQRRVNTIFLPKLACMLEEM